MRSPSAMAKALLTSAACGITTPLGCPVVPDVYWMSAVSVPSSSGRSTSPVGAPARSASVSDHGRDRQLAALRLQHLEHARRHDERARVGALQDGAEVPQEGLDGAERQRRGERHRRRAREHRAEERRHEDGARGDEEHHAIAASHTVVGEETRPRSSSAERSARVERDGLGAAVEDGERRIGASGGLDGTAHRLVWRCRRDRTLEHRVRHREGYFPAESAGVR